MPAFSGTFAISDSIALPLGYGASCAFPIDAVSLYLPSRR
jgi:hypothetical protein